MLNLVTDTLLLQDIRTLILGFWPNRHNDYFPGPLPVSIELKNFHKLKNYPYVICVKSDGTRYFLLIYKNKSYFIDRSFKVYHIEDVIHDSNTHLFDGELIVNNDGKHEYIIHDCICYNGKNISTESLDSRYESILSFSESIDQYVKDSNETKIKIGIKKFFNIKTQINEFKEYIKTINHKIDGYILTPLKLPIGTGTQYSLFKWKPLNMHTFDFRIKYDKGIFLAYVLQENTEILFASVSKTTEEGLEFSKKLDSLNFKNNDIVECEFNNNTKSFVPIMIRADKIHPNSLYTVEKTMFNIKENITEDELFTLTFTPRPN